MIINGLKPVVMVLAVAFGALALAACGSDSADPATAALAAATTVALAATAVPTNCATETVALPTTMTVPPAALPPVAPTSTPALDTVYSEYGFTLNLDLGADVQSAGYSESAPSETQGLASFVYSGVTVGLVWSSSNSKASLEFVAASYNDIQAAQPGINFELISGGDITVSGQTGAFGGFKAVDCGGTAIGGGLISDWNCSDDTDYRMTRTGADATAVAV